MIHYTGLSPANFCLLLSLFMTSSASAESAPAPLALQEAEEIALFAEPGHQELQFRAAAMRARADAAGELPDPTLRVGMNNFPIQDGGFTTEGMTNVGLGIRQAFPAGRTRAYASQQANLVADEMLENADARRRNVLTETRIAWLEVYFWNEAQQLITQSRPWFVDLSEVTQSLYAAGRRNQQDVLRAQLELSRLDDRLIDLERRRSGAVARLGKWIGDAALRPIANTFPEWDRVPPVEDLQASLPNHPLLRASVAQVRARDAGVELANQRSRPDWALELGYSYRNGSLPSGDPRSDFISVNVTVGMPFLRRKAVDSTLTAALQDRSAASSYQEKIRRELQSELQAEYAIWSELTRRLALYEREILRQSKSNAEASLLAYQSDSGQFSDVMRAYTDDLNINTEYARLRVERAHSYTKLANLGGIPR